jgi:hypothetical protein
MYMPMRVHTASSSVKITAPCGYNHAVHGKQDIAHFQVVVFFHNGGDYIHAASIAVIAVQNTASQSHKDAPADGGQDGIFNDGQRGQERQRINKKRQHDRAVDGDDQIEFPHIPQSHEHNRYIEQYIHGADRQTCQIINHHGYAGYSS